MVNSERIATLYRPEYANLGDTIQDAVGRIPMLALTATATRDTIRVLCENQVDELRRVVIRAPMMRQNLVLKIENKADYGMRNGQLLSAVGASVKPILVFLNSQRRCRQKADEIALQYPDLSVRYFHAGLSQVYKTDVLAAVQSGQVDVLCCTVAFGMGINVLIRSVIHWDVPMNLESYVQAVGRAGRDGQLAVCTLFWNTYDFDALQNRVRRRGVGVNRQAEAARKVSEYCASRLCRNKYILEYFEAVDRVEECGSCDVCKNNGAWRHGDCGM
jgi:ATP-dependent DNA helicase RecQ